MGNSDVGSIPTFSCYCRSCPSECGSATNVICNSVGIFKSSVLHLYFVTGLWVSTYIKTVLKLEITRCAIIRGCQVTRGTKFCIVAPNIYGSWVWHMLDITTLAHRILRRVLHFWKICEPPWLLPVTRSNFQMCVYFVTTFLGIILVNNQPRRTILFSYMFISILYMFRATSCSSSGESVVSIQLALYVTLCKWPSSMQVGKDISSRPAY
jgi:hypothetical protein